MSWTDERINLLKKMWKDGKSAAEIAKTLGKGVTRNAVIGKAHRMGLSGRPSPIKKPAPAAKKESAAPTKKEPAARSTAKKAVAAPPPAATKASANANAALAKEAEELKKIEKTTAIVGGGVALIDLTERMCKWPIGDPREADFSFCGRPIRVGTPYCPEHAAMAYQTSSRGRQQQQVVVAEEPEAEVEAVEPVEDEEEEAVG